MFSCIVDSMPHPTIHSQPNVPRIHAAQSIELEKVAVQPRIPSCRRSWTGRHACRMSPYAGHGVLSAEI